MLKQFRYLATSIRGLLGATTLSRSSTVTFFYVPAKRWVRRQLSKLIKDCIIKSTGIYLFCSTLFKDEAWQAIRKKIEKLGNELHLFTSIYEDGQDQLDLLI